MVALGLDVGLVVGCLLLVGASLGYSRGAETYARPSALLGFGVLAVVLVGLTGNYFQRPDRHIMPFVALTGVLLCLQAMWLVTHRWNRTHQLVTTTTVVLVLLVPFEVAPLLLERIQELLAGQVATIMGWLGYQVAIESSSAGAMTRLTFENNGYYNIARECTGVDGFALLAGLLVGARTTGRLKLAAIGFTFVAVYVVNMIRMVFVGSAIAGDWFGPLVTSGDTVQMTYYIAELGIGLTFVVLATIAFFLYMSRFIPDLREFVDELVETILDPRSIREQTVTTE